MSRLGGGHPWHNHLWEAVQAHSLQEGGRGPGDAQGAPTLLQANGTLCATARQECRTNDFSQRGECKTTETVQLETTYQWERSTSDYSN